MRRYPLLVDAGAIISRSIAANDTDWMADPLYDRCQREDDGDSRVLMLFGHHTSDDFRYFNYRRSSSLTESACQDIPER